MSQTKLRAVEVSIIRRNRPADRYDKPLAFYRDSCRILLRMGHPGDMASGMVHERGMENGLAASDERRRIEAEQRLRSHQDLALKLACAGSLSEALHLCLDSVFKASGMLNGAAYLLDPITHCMRLVCVEGAGIAFIDPVRNEPATEHLWSLLTSACPVYELSREMPVVADPAVALASLVVVPALHRGQTIASFMCASPEPRDASATLDRHAMEIITTLAGNSIAHLQSETALRAMSRRLMEVQEIERRHLARELHDEVGQCLTLLKMTLEGLRPTPELNIATFDDAMGQIDHLLSQVRNMALELRPSMLDDLGLLAALIWHTDRISKLTRIQVVCQHQGIEGRRFLPEVETSAYRILQEAITNSIRHSGSAQVTVRVWADTELLHLQVEDSGWGFDTSETLSQAASSGLRGMHERVLLLAGYINVESAPGRGTRITAALPLSASRTPNISTHEKNFNSGR